MEYYDGRRDPIKKYFSEKIQITFASSSFAHRMTSNGKEKKFAKEPVIRDSGPKKRNRIPVNSGVMSLKK